MCFGEVIQEGGLKGEMGFSQLNILKIELTLTVFYKVANTDFKGTTKAAVTIRPAQSF